MNLLLIFLNNVVGVNNDKRSLKNLMVAFFDTERKVCYYKGIRGVLYIFIEYYRQGGCNMKSLSIYELSSIYGGCVFRYYNLISRIYRVIKIKILMNKVFID